MGYLLNIILDHDAERVARLLEAFDLVMAAFATPADEVELAWSIALCDLDAAESAYYSTAAMLKAGWRPLAPNG